MKILCVADEDTNIMFGLLGIESRVIQDDNPEKLQQEFDQILQDKDIGVILMKEKYLLANPKYFKNLKTQHLPLIIELPDILNPLLENDFEDYIKKILQIP